MPTAYESGRTWMTRVGVRSADRIDAALELLTAMRPHAVGIGFLDIKLSNPLSVRDVYTSGMQVLRTIKETSLRHAEGEKCKDELENP